MNTESSKAFWQGFWRGMAGATTLYSIGDLPPVSKVVITPLRPPILDPVEAMRADWIQTGKDIEAAISRYSSTAT